MKNSDLKHYFVVIEITYRLSGWVKLKETGSFEERQRLWSLVFDLD